MTYNLEQLKELCINSSFLHLADMYIPYLSEKGQIPFADLLAQRLENMDSMELLVPVLGIQGTGKSSLLNALLMDDIVLPVDADETTCIPVEIRFGLNDGEIIIFFKGQTVPLQTYDYKILDEYVNNANNPGNEKQVSHVVIYKNNQLLAGGVVLVDLPGVGSMTPRNVETTMSYIERLTAAIFLLRTNPPITRHEKIFLTMAWPKLTRAWFIQNQWNDESELEVNEGKEHNLYILRQIADQYNTSKDIEVMIVNIFKALGERLSGNNEDCSESGIERVREILDSLSRGWKELLEQELDNFLRKCIDSIKLKISELLKQAQLSNEELQNEIKISEQILAAEIEDNRQLIAGIEEKVSYYRMELLNFANQVSKKQEQYLRAEMRRIVGGGLTDGYLLNSVFIEQQDIAFESAIFELTELTFSIQSDLQNELEELRIPDMSGQYVSAREFFKKESIKLEKFLPPAASIGGGIAGIWAGAKTLGAVGTFIGGPVGTVIGSIAGVAVAIGIGALGNWLGTTAKKGITVIKENLTMADIEPLIYSFKKDLEDHIETTTNQVMDEVEKELVKFKEFEKLQLDRKKQENREHIEKCKADFQSYINDLKYDLETINSIEEGITNE